MSKTLGGSKDLFVKEPALWQALVRTIPDHIRNDEEVRKSLKFLLKEIMQEKAEKNWDDVIDQVHKGTPLRAFILKQIVIDGEKKADVEVELLCGDEKFLMSKTRLQEASEFFAGEFSGKFQKPLLTYGKEDPERFKLFVEVIRGQVTLDVKNIWSVLDAAVFYQMPKTIALCDLFIRDTWTQNSKNLIHQWLIRENNEDEEDPQSFFAQWKFCKTYSLLQTKRFLASELLLRISQQEDKVANFGDLKAMIDDDLKEILLEQRAAAVKNLLSRPKFLKWIWENGQKNPTIKKLILECFAIEKNKKFLEKAWVTGHVPEELLNAGEEDGDAENEAGAAKKEKEEDG